MSFNPSENYESETHGYYEFHLTYNLTIPALMFRTLALSDFSRSALKPGVCWMTLLLGKRPS